MITITPENQDGLFENGKLITDGIDPEEILLVCQNGEKMISLKTFKIYTTKEYSKNKFKEWHGEVKIQN